MLPYKSQKCRLTSPYDWRIHPITKIREFHHGVDLVAIGGDEVVAVRDGRVVMSRIVLKENDTGKTWQWGNYIAITGTDGVTIYYCHLDKRLVKVGQAVKAGDVIGIEGKTGQATGVHLHFECRRGTKQIDAAEYLGIDNAVGTYDGTHVAVDKLAREGIISSPEYWREHARDIEYLDTLLIRVSDYPIRKAESTICADVNAALDRLVKAGVINTPLYWQKNADKVKFLPDLIRKLGGSV